MYSKFQFEVKYTDYSIIYYRSRGGYYFYYSRDNSGYCHIKQRISKATFDAAHLSHLYNTGYIKRGAAV